jgi:hypothetical protein
VAKNLLLMIYGVMTNEPTGDATEPLIALLIVGGRDEQVIRLNEEAYAQLNGKRN